MVDPSVPRSNPPLYVARAQCSFLADETTEVKEDGGEGRRRRKARRRRARRRGSFCSHLESATRRGLPLFHVSPFALPRSSSPLALSLPFSLFHLLSLCASVTPSPSRPSLSLLPRPYLSSPLSFSLYLSPFARVYPLPRLMPFVSGKRD